MVKSIPVSASQYEALYPTLNDYMGLPLTSDELAIISASQNDIAIPQSTVSTGSGGVMVAPLSGSTLGLQRANITHGIREVILCKNAEGKVGMRVQAINKVRDFNIFMLAASLVNSFLK